MTIGLILIILLVAVAGFFVQIYNSLVQLRQRVKNAWAQVDVQLKRRYDLIPNLVNTVKGYAEHEKTTLENVIKARNNAVNAEGAKDQAQAENMLSGAIRSLFALAEAYPDLKANASFLDLQQKLNEIEENLERSRRYYNGTVRENNTYGESMPGVLFAGMFSYQHFDYFEAEAAERENVKVSFN